MKTRITLALMVSITLYAAQSVAQSKSDIFDKNVEVNWLGLDMTRAKLIGDRERLGSYSDIGFLVKSWNDMLEKEANKYDAARATRKRTASRHLDVAQNHNESIDFTEMLSNDKTDADRLTESGVADVVNSYDFHNLSGLGLLFVADSFNKNDEKAIVWVTFINIGTKEILLTKKMIGRPGGASLTAFWCNSLNEIMERMPREMESWKKSM